MPVGFEESELVQSIAEDRWRLKRARAVENSIYASGVHDHSLDHDTGHAEVDDALAEGRVWIEHGRFLTSLSQFERRILRSIHENTAELKALQAARKEAYAQARKEAILLAQLADSKGEIYNPAPDFGSPAGHGGFVFDFDALNSFIDREERLSEALYLRYAPPKRIEKDREAA